MVDNFQSTFAENAIDIRPAVIWARVSTSNQADTSLPTQIDRCKTKLEQTGYSLIQIYQTDWSSLDLYACPDFQNLRSQIKNREIMALAIYDRDRLEAKGLQRLVFLAECKDAGVELVICQGPPLLDGSEGQLVELALAIGKERSVIRARQGSKDGLRDRAIKRGLPTSHHKVYGYEWDKATNRLVPNSDWPNVKLIFDMILDGASYLPIIQELKRRGILTPSGQAEWNKTTISGIVHNPLYAGRYYALKEAAVEPKKRRGNTYGNSSTIHKSIDQAHLIPEIGIVTPPITWEQRTFIIQQLADHQKLSQRNAKRDYLLRGMIFCGTHRGKKGEPIRYHGQPHKNTWRYVCHVGGCRMPFIRGQEIEDFVLMAVATTLSIQPDELFNRLKLGNQDRSKGAINAELEKLIKQYDRGLDSEVRLEERFLGGQVIPAIYARIKEKLHNERRWIEEEKENNKKKLEQLGKEDEVIKTITDLRTEFSLFDRALTKDQWKKILTKLNVKVSVHSEETKNDIVSDIAASLEAEGKDPSSYVESSFQSYRNRTIDTTDISVEIGIDIKPDILNSINGIASPVPSRG